MLLVWMCLRLKWSKWSIFPSFLKCEHVARNKFFHFFLLFSSHVEDESYGNQQHQKPITTLRILRCSRNMLASTNSMANVLKKTDTHTHTYRTLTRGKRPTAKLQVHTHQRIRTKQKACRKCNLHYCNWCNTFFLLNIDIYTQTQAH